MEETRSYQKNKRDASILNNKDLIKSLFGCITEELRSDPQSYFHLDEYRKVGDYPGPVPFDLKVWPGQSSSNNLAVANIEMSQTISEAIKMVEKRRIILREVYEQLDELSLAREETTYLITKDDVAFVRIKSQNTSHTIYNDVAFELMGRDTTLTHAPDPENKISKVNLELSVAEGQYNDNVMMDFYKDLCKHYGENGFERVFEK